MRQVRPVGMIALEDLLTFLNDEVMVPPSSLRHQVDAAAAAQDSLKAFLQVRVDAYSGYLYLLEQYHRALSRRSVLHVFDDAGQYFAEFPLSDRWDDFHPARGMVYAISKDELDLPVVTSYRTQYCPADLSC